MKVKAKHKFQHKGVQFEQGHVVTLPDEEAKKLIDDGHVEEHKEDPKSAAPKAGYGGGQTGESQH